MRTLAAILVLATAGPAPAGQTPARATTEDGRKVLLYPDGKWKYEPLPKATPGPRKVHARVSAATEKVDLLRGGMTLFIDPGKWKLTPSEDPTKMSFRHASGEAYGMVVAERLAIPLPRLKEIAISNARDAAPDVRVTFEEPRRVNEVDVLAMQMEGTIQGIPFTYYGYYFSGPQGSLQLLTYTGSNLFAEYKPEFEDFLNGLTPPVRH
ncbi:MAG TPA: hypothetical protein VFO85_21740 [Vicinamibacteria bacterium]|nr:hypothetical protein [Vicinamibacteria bacterium]